MGARPFVIGLTGAIGMGKSETARLFAAEGVPVFDADAAVHALYAGEGAAMIEAAFPGTTHNGVVDRTALSHRVLEDAAALSRLEGIVHPLVVEARARFLDAAERDGTPLVLLDIPLLLETGIAVDALVVASAPEQVQRQRVLARPGMTEAKFAGLAARQQSDAQKRAQAHFIVVTDKGLEHAREQVKMILAEIRQQLPSHA